MRFYLVWFFCLCFLFIRCSDDKRKVPAGIMPEHDMAELLTDIVIIDGSMYNFPQHPDSIAKHGLGLYMAVFKLHNTDTATFRKSLKYFTTRPDLMYEISAGINRRLEKKLDSLKKIKPVVNTDSVNKARVLHRADSVAKVKKPSRKLIR